MAQKNIATLSIRAPKNIDEILAAGLKRIMEFSDAQIKDIMTQFAIESLKGAIRFYDESIDPRNNLTGNTRTGFCAALYKDGLLRDTFVGYRVAGIRGPMWHYARVGDTGFTDYGTGERLSKANGGYVRPYRNGLPWQDVDGGHAYTDTLNALRSMTPECRKGWVCIIANASPYVSFLVQVRHFDVLTSSLAYHKKTLKEAVASFAQRGE